LGVLTLVCVALLTLSEQSTSLNTNLSFPAFQSADNFIMFGKVRHNPGNRSFVIDTWIHQQLKRVVCEAVATLHEHAANRSGWLPHVIGLLFTFTIGSVPSGAKYERFEVLPLELRVSVLAGVAAAVEYLHEEWVKCKSSIVTSSPAI
jgi:hypothetical protein